MNAEQKPQSRVKTTFKSNNYISKNVASLFLFIFTEEHWQFEQLEEFGFFFIKLPLFAHCDAEQAGMF